MAERNLFISFAESDGGHSYLAMRAMLNPDGIGHLLFRNTPAEALEALGANQANLAVVPFYNSITQWEGSAVRALATGQFEIKAQICMPTSYVLAAHREHINIALGLYAAERNILPENLPDFTNLDEWLKRRADKYRLDFPNATEEERKKYEEREVESAKDSLKTYTRLLTTIYVGAQADEQYRGRLLRPDMNKVDVDLTRNPLRVLEEVNRSDLMKSMARSQGPQPQPVYPGAGGIGTSPYAPINLGFGSPPALKDFKGPAALVAKGLMDAPGNQEGWDKPGSLGEIVALLRKLQVLLDVYSFGPPDLPDNKTLYLLLGRKGEKVKIAFDPAIVTPDSPIRVMTLFKGAKTVARESWIKPRDILHRRTPRVVYDRPPIMVSPPHRPVFLQEGGFPQMTLGNAGDLAGVGDNLKKLVERKSGEAKPRYEISYLGIYPTCCHANCHGWLCSAAAETEEKIVPFDWKKFWAAMRRLLPLLFIAALLLLAYLSYTTHEAYCQSSDSFWCTGHIDWSKSTAPPPPDTAPTPATPPPPDASTATPTPSPYPTSAAPDHATPDHEPPPPPPASHVPAPPVAGPPPYSVPPDPVFNVPFFEAKSNLLPEALTALRDAAMRALETEKLVKLRIMALGPHESDDDLWRRRYQAVKDELVRLGVPADRIMQDGNGNDVVIRQRVVHNTRTSRQRMTMELIPDPMSGDDDQ